MESGSENSGPSTGTRGDAPRALLLYAACTVILTWPLALHLGDRLPAGSNDLWQNYWNFWWWKTALLERGQLPYATDLIYQPGETSLAFHTHSEANILTTFPILAAAGPAAALNTAILLGFVLSGWGAYLLCREVLPGTRAAFIGGLVFAFFPQRFEQSLEHLNLASCQAMPIFLYALLRLARRGGAGSIALAAGTFAWNALYSWHNGLLILPAALILHAHSFCRAPRPRLHILRDTAIAACAAAVILLPFLWPMLSEIADGATYYVKPAVRKGIDPLFLVLPAEGHPLWGSLVRDLYERLRGYPSAGFTCYLGIAALALAACAPSRRAGSASSTGVRPGFPRGIWSSILALHVLLACGATLVMAGKDTGFPLPFAWLQEVPILKTLRVANRFVVPAMIALSVLAAAGGARLLAKAEARGGAWKRTVLPACLALIALDYLWVPYPTREIPAPPWIQAVRAAPPGLLLDLPGGHRARGAEDMFHQTLHGRPMVGGYASCLPPAMERRVQDLPFLKLVFEGRPAVDVDVASGLSQVLGALPVSVVVLHLDRKRERLEDLARAAQGSRKARFHDPEKGTAARVIDEARAALEDLWGKPAYADPNTEVYWRRAE
ncbi:MAG TPA: hypothetical protein VMT52_19180 [Planctomycetota bacterium]|nr:hypothetical protein [Planctomycetota bacterium]